MLHLIVKVRQAKALLYKGSRIQWFVSVAHYARFCNTFATAEILALQGLGGASIYIFILLEKIYIYAETYSRIRVRINNEVNRVSAILKKKILFFCTD
jgi:hypothetical protein